MRKKKILCGMSMVLLMMVTTTCGTTKAQSCIDKSRINDDPCTLEYNPVCGCDGQTYGNPCQADHAGLTSWKKGECGETDPSQ